MSTYQKSTKLCEPAGNEAIDYFTLTYMSGHGRHLAHEALVEAFIASGISKATLAKRLGWDKSRLSKILNVAQNITMETFSAVLFAIDGASPKFGKEYSLRKNPTNFQTATNPRFNHTGLVTYNSGTTVATKIVKTDALVDD